MGERQFKRGLGKAGSAALIRETVSQAVRESACLSKAKLVEPLDYETVIVKNKQALFNDPQREMLLFPQDDVSASVLPRRFRTVRCSVPDSASKEASSLFVKESIKSYVNDWNLVHYKYNAYSGTYQQLPRKTHDKEALPEQTYEVDAEVDDKDEVTDAPVNKGAHSITKQGWLYKGPDSRHDTGIISFTRSFKRRYFYLKQQADTTYVLEFHKDDKKLESKGTIFLDSATSVVKSSKRGRNTLEINMQDKSFYLLGADSEGEIDDWIRTLKKVVQSNENNNCDASDKMKGDAAAADRNNQDLDYGTHPELAKYARETDSYLANLRQEGRQKVFRIYPDLPRPLPMADLDENDVDVFREQFGKRFIVSCEEFRTKLQANIADDTEPEALDNPEPFFISLSLYDGKEGKKISEDFHYDPNSAAVRRMIPGEMLQANDKLNTVNGNTTEPELHGLDDRWLIGCKQCIFSVIRPNPEIYLVAKIEKVLSSGITAATDPYVKNSDIKVGTKIHRQMRTSCSRVGHYRMPFGWAARPVFKPYSMEFDTTVEFTVYKQESSRVAEEELVKHLQDFRRPEKQGKWQVIPASFKVKVEPFEDGKTPLSNILTPSLVPVRSFADPPEQPPSHEVEEFNPETGHTSFPFTTYTNSLYVYPKQLKYDSQKAFAKARNIACCIELRDSDLDNTVPLKCIYGHACNSVFTTVASTAVLHHSCYPDYYEEVKMALPVQLNDKHHLFFTFYHVSCDIRPHSSRGSTNKRKEHIESVVGYAWLPLLTQGRVNVGEQNLSVASHIQAGYLSYEPLGLGKGHSGPDIRWVEGAKQLFRCDLRLISTVYTKDPHLHNFFQHCEKTDGAPTPANDMETSNKLKSLLAVDVGTMINFLPTLINQLFRLLPQTNSEDVAMNTVKVLINLVAMVTEVRKQDILHSFVKYVFMTEPAPSPKHKTIHEELAKNLTSTLRPANTDHLVINKFLHHSWFFFEILIKSMAQHLLVTGRIKMSRNERFPSNYQYRVQTMVQTLLPHIMQRFKEVPKETQLANRSLANFIKSCFTFMDRGFVFRLINLYMDSFNIGDPKVLHEYKFDFLRIVCSHEHFIPLNLPMMKKGHVKSYKDLKHDYTLSEEFRKNHFLVGLLLEECKSALNELPEIRKFAIYVLRNLLAKHSFDDRFSSKQQQSRIASLYLPLITLILENINRLGPVDVKQTATLPNGDVPPDTPDTPNKSNSLPQHRSMISLPTGEGGAGGTGTTPREKNRDSNVFAMIAGPSVSSVSISEPKPLQSSNSIHGSSTSLASNTSSVQSNMTNATDRNSEASERDKTSRSESFKENGRPDKLGQHHRSQSMCGSPLVPRTDRLDPQEIKDLLVSFIYIVKNLSEEILLGWFNNSSEFDILDFFNVLDLCLFHFRYIGKNRILALSRIGDTSRKALTLPPKRAAQMYIQGNQRALSQYGEISEGGYHNPPEPPQPSQPAPTQSDADAMYRTMLEANLATEVGMIALDVVSLYCNNFKEQLVYKFGDNSVMKKVFEIYLSFLATSQSQTLLKHAFAAMRAFIYKFPMVLFQGNATMCGDLCYEILRCCNSRLRTTRSEACALMYMLMRSNFEFSGKSGFTRVHLQMIISVSQLISDVVGINGSRFSESLSIINSYANSDKAMQHTAFPVEVKDLTKRIRTVLMATAQMKEHENDPEMLIDLQYSLAKSYASTPELRKTWLDSMAKIHIKHDNHSEAAHCYLHVAALIAEYLKRRGTYPQGCTAFKKISPNIEPEESGIKDDTGMQDVQYTEDTLVEQLEQCARGFEKAERYEMLGEIYRLIIPIYEKKRDFQKLSDSYLAIHRNYEKVVEVMQSGRRLLGKYFRVAFFGQFYEEEDNKQYIYKEPRVTSLTEICDRLKKLFGEKFGKENVKLIMDSKKVNPRDLNAKYAYIQVTYVQPYFDEKELEERQTEFERTNNVRRFMYETPFTKNDSKAHGLIEEQYKRRTILTTSHSFPYVKKRIMVVYHQEVELSPIEVAIDGMQTKTTDLNEVVLMSPPDMKKLQLKLQGSVSVQVNAGPMAYAEAFLSPDKVFSYPKHKVESLKDIYREFVRVCNQALELNATLIKSEQLEYQDAMRENFRDIVMKLSMLFNEQLLPEVERPSLSHRASLTIFNVISTTPGTSTV